MSSNARDLLLIILGMAMGLGLHEVAHMAWDWLAEWRKGRDQWFRKQTGPDAPGAARPPVGVPQPPPRPIKGQRAPEGRHRPKQTQARFAGRVRRRVVKQPARVGAPIVEESPGQDDGD